MRNAELGMRNEGNQAPTHGMNRHAPADHPGAPAAGSSDSAFRIPHSALLAWWVLVAHSFQRHWRVRQMGWVAVGLLAVTVTAVAVVTNRPGGWNIEDRRVPRTKTTYRQQAEQLR